MKLSFTMHVYGQRFGYDLSGRRLWTKHPAQLAPSGGVDSVAYGYDPVFGELGSLRDVFGNTHRYAYDLAGRPVRLTKLAQRADSVYDVLAYDADSRLVRRSVKTGSAVIRQDSLWYDARDKVTAETFSGDAVAYAPLGPIVSSVLSPSGLAETFVWDALGNQVRSSGPPTNYAYQAGSGRLLQRRVGTAGQDTTTYAYALDGQLGDATTKHWVSTQPQTIEHRYTSNFYNPEQRLTKSRYRLDTSFVNSPPGYRDYVAEETYRYDALGRRIYTRVIRGTNCATKDRASGCRSSLTRTIWDGDQVLYEIRVPGDSTSNQLEHDTPEPGSHSGRVGYLHVGEIDQPLALWKGTQLVLPHANWHGVYVQGTCSSAPCTDVWFPGAEGTTFLDPPTYPDGPPSWHGSLLESGQDASGYQYRRNRVYDPKTGRFTQEDPIGLAGGLNLYGYADGDPVNFSDPFGLIPWCGPLAPLCARVGVWILGTAAPFLSRIGGAMTGLSAGPTNPRAAATIGRLNATLRGNIDKVDDIHLNAAARELAGEVVARDLSGRPYDHVTEVRSAMQGLRNVISGVENLLERGRPTAEQAEVAVRLRQQAIEALRRAEEALRQQQTQQ